MTTYMAKYGGYGKGAYFASHAELNRKYTVRDMLEFFEQPEVCEKFGWHDYSLVNSIYNNLKRSPCYDIEFSEGVRPRYLIVKSNAVTPRMIRRKKKWTEETILADAAKYEYVHEWQEANPSVVILARRMKIYQQARKHMKQRKRGRKQQWTEKTILQSLKGFDSYKEWRFTHARASQLACQLGIADKCKQIIRENAEAA